MSRDRYIELKSLGNTPGGANTPPPPYVSHAASPGGAGGLGSTTMDQFQRQADIIEDGINSIHTLVDDIYRLHSQSLGMSGQPDIERQKNIKIDEMNQLIRDVGKDLKRMGSENDQMSSAGFVDAGDIAIRRGRHGALFNRYYDEVQKYRAMEDDFKNKYQQQLEHHIRVIKPHATDEEINAAIHSDQARSIFAQSVMGNNESRRVLREVEERHQDIKKIEQSAYEINQLFTELQDMIQRQQTMVDDIEQAVENARNYTKQGVEQVNQGITIRKKTRKRMWLLLVLLVIIIVIVVIIILKAVKVI
ncbi:hypothetical protein EV182_002540 [Spiromyces aspiralis]|uniref:Uncharacterized protein n=1 Tax=Spiromyces aspiralis TaxID=68401 RepID=A0ACC1HI54_9FUNG|nr:hypothetical protein EV182_002540 [Spiromyces aspiralis]